MKYNIPTIKITSFLTENVVTEPSATINTRYVPEVQTFMGTTLTTEQYKARVESVKNILAFTTPSGGKSKREISPAVAVGIRVKQSDELK